MKAYHKGIGGIDFQDIEINDESGCPFLNDKNAQISISHEKYAVAFVIVEK